METETGSVEIGVQDASSGSKRDGGRFSSLNVRAYQHRSADRMENGKGEGRTHPYPRGGNYMLPVSVRRGPGGIVERVELEQQARAGHSGSSQGLRACDGTRGMLNEQRP